MKILNIAMDVLLVAALTLVILFCMGIRIFTVQSGSMSPFFEPGAAAVVNTRVNNEEIEIGDIVVYRRENMNIIHRVIAITDEGIETKGDANQISDGIAVTPDNLVGQYITHIDGLGHGIDWLKSPMGMCVMGALLVALFAVCIHDFLRTRRQDDRLPER